MPTVKEQFIEDENGNRVGVFLTLRDYEMLLEELDALRALGATPAPEGGAISFAPAIISQDTPPA